MTDETFELLDRIFAGWHEVRLSERVLSYTRGDVVAVADTELERVELIRDGFAPVFLRLDGGTRDAIERVVWLEVTA